MPGATARRLIDHAPLHDRVSWSSRARRTGTGRPAGSAVFWRCARTQLLAERAVRNERVAEMKGMGPVGGRGRALASRASLGAVLSGRPFAGREFCRTASEVMCKATDHRPQTTDQADHRIGSEEVERSSAIVAFDVVQAAAAIDCEGGCRRRTRVGRTRRAGRRRAITCRSSHDAVLGGDRFANHRRCGWPPGRAVAQCGDALAVRSPPSLQRAEDRRALAARTPWSDTEPSASPTAGERGRYRPRGTVLAGPVCPDVQTGPTVTATARRLDTRSPCLRVALRRVARRMPGGHVQRCAGLDLAHVTAADAYRE